jgi:hypothetical protein
MPKEVELTAEEQQQAELDALHAEQEKAEQAIREADEKKDKLVSEAAALKLKDAVSAARKASGFSFYSSTPELIKFLQVEPGFLVNAEAESYFVDGRKVELVEMLQTFAGRRKWSRAETQTEKSVREGKAHGIRSKEDLTTTKSKTDYVAKHGHAAFAALPLHPPVADDKIQSLTPEEFTQLPVAQKVRFVRKHGEQGVSNLRHNR